MHKAGKSGRILPYLWVFILLATALPERGAAAGHVVTVLDSKTVQAEQDDRSIFFPMLQSGPVSIIPTSPLPLIPRVNAPFFEDSYSNWEGAIFWFGQVNSEENYTDVRVGYTADKLYLRLNIFDRKIWLDHSPTPESIMNWDSASLYLSLNGETAFRFDAQVYDGTGPSPYHVAYTRSAAEWRLASIPFVAQSSWRGNAPNDDLDDRGWFLLYEIPFTSLGLQSAPAGGSAWKIGLKVYDRDDAAGSSRPVQAWPAKPLSDDPGRWGNLVFGLPVYTPPQGVLPGGTITVRHKLDGVVVKDTMVGGGAICGSGLNFWNEWGDANYAGRLQVNVQNQIDVADWPCFSKYYLTFPLSSLPAGKAILSAELTLHHFGNAGGGDYEDPPLSLIQVMTVASEWEENTLTWNNAPQAMENVSRAWVEPISELTDWRGIPRTWDLSLAVSQAYNSGEPLRLVLYSADEPMHTGKYFFTSKVDDYSAVSRPTLNIVWGNP